MGGALTSLVAVAGTLLGSVVTFIFQRRTANRAEELAWRRLLREERLAAYSGFAEAVVAYRRAQYEPFGRRLEAEDSPALAAAESESYQRRTVAQQALFRVQLVSVDSDLVLLAEGALKATKAIREATDAQSLRDSAGHAKQALDDFVRIAGERVRA